MKKLYIVYLGGTKEKERFAEDHEVVMVISDSQIGAMSKAKSKWKGIGKAHVDRVMQVDTVDGFDIKLLENTKSKGDILKECKNDYS
jgi:hypothetical protein